jgi:hypothetical protein
MTVGFAICSDHSALLKNASLYEAMLNSDFAGMSGQVRFDDHGHRQGNTVELVLFNWNKDPNTSRVTRSSTRFYRDEDGAFLLNDEVEFKAGFGIENIPPNFQVSPPEENMLGLLVVLGYIEVGIVNAICFVMLVWIMWHRKEKMIYNAQPEMQVLIIVGCAIASWSVIFLSNDETIAFGCQLAPLCFFLGSQLALVVLFAKTMRISYIFNNKKMEQVRFFLEKPGWAGKGLLCGDVRLFFFFFFMVSHFALISRSVLIVRDEI